MLIIFEGIDGAGKGAQIRLLSSFFRQHGIRFAIHKYPTKKAKAAFSHLSGSKTIPPEELAGVFAADIMGEQEKVMREISQGKVVICDRYLHSTLAYQGVGAAYGRLAQRLSSLSAPVPDLVLLLDIQPAESSSRKRAQKKPDRHERDTTFLSAVRKNYLRMEKENFLAYKYFRIDASEEREKVFSHVVSQVEPFVTGMRKK